MKFPRINAFDFHRVTVNLMKAARRENRTVWSDLEYVQAGRDRDKEFVKNILRFCGLKED